ncbi:hypothetical protein [Streptomyces sp. I05A-00742]|uniref:hypothetical protein n=1 Tax=Streptomyces sp. I05A-00742 TaxID=2732853 RepID=UPI00289974C3|nr:hypothetical protein [Streptomyces sp. I05A-00742]
MVGIESDQLVYDYLSKVGDIAQRRSLTSGDRMRLVSRLRTEIERRRAAESAETPAAVRRILDGLGTPDEAVAGAGGEDPAGPAAPGRVPAQRREPATGAVRFPDAGAPPHLATEEELRGPAGSGRTGGEWWRVEQMPFGAGETAFGGGETPFMAGETPFGAGETPFATGETPFAAGGRTHGFTGGIEIPDMLKPPPSPEELARQRAGAEARPDDPLRPSATVGEQAPSDEGVGAPRRRFPFRRADGGQEGTVPMSPLLALVAVLLVVGAVLGNWIVMVAGWALAYITRRLTQTESKWAVMGVPGLAAGGAVVWLWGRLEHRWGAPVAQGQLGATLVDTLPVVVRVAAVGSALFVLWRARRPG